MKPRAPVRIVVAATLGIAAGTSAWIRAAPMEPFLDFAFARTTRAADHDVWDFAVTARGGETVGVRVAPGIGPLRVVGRNAVERLESGRTASFRLEVDHVPERKPCAVRVTQTGRGSRTIDVLLEERP